MRSSAVRTLGAIPNLPNMRLARSIVLLTDGCRRLAFRFGKGRGMPTAVWTGSLSLGLVVVPVRLYPAVKKKTVRFHELDRSGRRVRHVRVAEPEIDYESPVIGHAMRLPESTRG